MRKRSRIEGRIRSQRGKTLLELLIALALVAVVGVLIADYVNGTRKTAQVAATSLLVNRTVEDIAQRLAFERIEGPRRGAVVVTENGVEFENTGKDAGGKLPSPPAGKLVGRRFSYSARVTVFPNGLVYVFVTMRGADGVTASASSSYRVDPRSFT